MRTKFLCISVFRVASGPRVKLASCKSALNSPVVYSTDRSKAVIPVLVLLFVALWLIYEAICFMSYLVLFYFCVFFSPFSIAITSLGEEKSNLSAFRTFVLFALVWFLSVSPSSWCLGRVADCDCGTPWFFLLPFYRAIETSFSTPTPLKSNFPAERSKTIPMLQFFLFCMSFIAIVPLWFVLRLFFIRCRWKAKLRYCGCS